MKLRHHGLKRIEEHWKISKEHIYVFHHYLNPRKTTNHFWSPLCTNLFITFFFPLVLYCILTRYLGLIPEKFKPLFFIRTFDNSPLLNFSYSLLIAVSYGRAKSHSKWLMMGSIFLLGLKSDMVYCLHTLTQVFSL